MPCRRHLLICNHGHSPARSQSYLQMLFQFLDCYWILCRVKSFRSSHEAAVMLKLKKYEQYFFIYFYFKYFSELLDLFNQVFYYFQILLKVFQVRTCTFTQVCSTHSQSTMHKTLQCFHGTVISRNRCSQRWTYTTTK